MAGSFRFKPKSGTSTKFEKESKATTAVADPFTRSLRTKDHAALSIAILLAACVFPLALLLRLRSTFSADWVNHLWVISYYGAYFSAHHQFPAVLNTLQLAGLLNSIFYNHHFYAALGFLSTVLGPDLSVRLGALLALGVQFSAVRKSVDLCGGSLFLSNTAAVLVTWGIYPAYKPV